MVARDGQNDADGMYIRSSVVYLKRDPWCAVYHRYFGGLCLVDDAAKHVLDSFSVPQHISSRILTGEDKSLSAKLIRQYILRDFLTAWRPPAVKTLAKDTASQLAPIGVKIIQLVLANACNFACTYCFERIEEGNVINVLQDSTGYDAQRGQGAQKVDREALSYTTEKPTDLCADVRATVYSGKERAHHEGDPNNRLMRPAAAVEYVSMSVRLAKAAGVDSVMIQFFGGEPLLNWAAIDAVLKEFRHGENVGVRIDYSIVTNGSLVSDDIAKALAQYNVAVCVSFDSPSSTSRKLKNGNSSVPFVVNGLAILRKYNNRVVINATLAGETWECCNESIILFAAEHGINEVGVVLDLNPSFYAHVGQDRIVERLWMLIECGRRYNVVVTGYWHQVFQLLCGVDAVRPRGYKMCSAKGCQVSIEPNGSVFACKGASGYFGKISDGEGLLKTDAFRRHARLALENPAYCNGCDIESFCSGFCLGPLEKTYGRIDVVEPDTCDVYKRVTRKLIENVAPYQVPTFELAKERRRNEQLSYMSRFA